MKLKLHADALTEDAAISLEKAFEGFEVEIERKGVADFLTADIDVLEKEIALRIAKAMIPRQIMRAYYSQLSGEDRANEERWQEEQREMEAEAERNRQYTEASDPAMGGER